MNANHRLLESIIFPVLLTVGRGRQGESFFVVVARGCGYTIQAGDSERELSSYVSDTVVFYPISGQR